MQDEKKIREEVYLSVEEQLKNETMELDKELERLEREKLRLMIIRELNSENESTEGKVQMHKAHEDSAIEDLEKKQAKVKKDLDDKHLKMSKLIKLKSKYVK